MEFVLGIDSGGTNYRVQAQGVDGRLLGAVVGPQASHRYLEREELLRRMNGTLDECLAQFGGKRQEIRYVVCGTTGIDSDEVERIVRECYESLEGVECPVKLLNDAELAHYTVTEGKGVLLISGTGSIAFGVNPEGKTGRAGGWPLPILGDQGSGTWVTKMALRHLGRWLDGAVEDTLLTKGIRSQFGIATRGQLIQTAAAGKSGPEGLPKLGALVNEAAAAGDPYAVEILKGAAAELLPIVEDVVAALDLEQMEPDFELGLWGSNLLKSSVMLEEFKRLIGIRFPQARIRLPEREAIDGAVDMALKLCEQNMK